MVFEDQTAVTLKWDATLQQPVVVSKQDLSEQFGLPSERVVHGVVDVSCSYVACSLLQGHLKIMKIKKNGALDAPYAVRLEESRVIDMCFVDPDVFGAKKGEPTLAILYSDADGMSHIKTYSLRERKCALVEASFSQKNLERMAERVVSGPGGIIVLGVELIAYIAPNVSRAISIADFSTTETRGNDLQTEEGNNITALCRVDSLTQSGQRRFLLGSETGKLYSLTIGSKTQDGGEVMYDGVVVADKPTAQITLELEALGYITSARCITWIGGPGSNVFIGSDAGDSLLLSMLSRPFEDSWFKVVETITNLGPITSFALVPNHVGGSQLITCSGKERDGTLRIVRNGVGVTNVAGIPLPGVQDLWCLKRQMDDVEHQLVVLSFVNATKFLELAGEQISETNVPGFAQNKQTLLCQNIIDNAGRQLWLQATSDTLYLVDPTTGRLVCEKKLPAQLTRVAVLNTTALCAFGATLVMFQCVNGALEEKKRIALSADAACLTLFDPLTADYANIQRKKGKKAHNDPKAEVMEVDQDDVGEEGVISPHNVLCAVGLWSTDVQLISFSADGPTEAQILATESVGCDSLPRSILFHTLANEVYLLCGLGNGSLVTWTAGFNNFFKFFFSNESKVEAQLSSRRRLKLGTRAVSLTPMFGQARDKMDEDSDDTSCVFVSSDKPTLLFQQNGRLTYSAVNIKGVASAAVFNSAALSSSVENLVLLTEGALEISSLTGRQKLHAEVLPVQSTVNCICYHKQSGYYGVGLDYQHDREKPANVLAIVTESTGQDEPFFISQFALDPDEMPVSICSTVFFDDSIEYIVVGTAFIAEEEEVKNGRVLVFSFIDSKLHLVTSTNVHGGVYKIIPFLHEGGHGGKLAVGINSILHIMKWVEAGDGCRELVSECSQAGHLLIISLNAQGSTLLVGDLYRSVTVFSYKAEDSSLEEVSHDTVERHVTCSEILSDSCYIVCDDSCNMFTVSAAESVDDPQLTVTSRFHLGHFVNQIERGSLDAESAVADEAVSLFEYCNGKKSAAEGAGLVLEGCSYIFATAQGTIGSLRHLTQVQYEFLDALQQEIASVWQ